MGRMNVACAPVAVLKPVAPIRFLEAYVVLHEKGKNSPVPINLQHGFRSGHPPGFGCLVRFATYSRF